MSEYDVIVIGAGHNGLIAAAYLAQAGKHVCVLEKRHIVGGAVATEELVPGYQFDVGGSAHILIRGTPVVQELGLEQYGLDYIDLDPLFFAPFEDGDSLFLYRDLDRTAQHLESKFPSQGEAYRDFCNRWQPFARMVRDAFLSALRPFLGMASYRTHIDGLFLAGASTHPGGGIMGASGRNAARVVMRALDRKWWGGRGL